MLSYFIASLLYYVEYYDREMDRVIVITYIGYSIHYSAQSHIHNKH